MMKIIFNRTSNDHLISDSGERTVEEFEVNPEDFNHEMVGWEFQTSTFDAHKDELKIFSEFCGYLHNRILVVPSVPHISANF